MARLFALPTRSRTAEIECEIIISHSLVIFPLSATVTRVSVAGINGPLLEVQNSSSMATTMKKGALRFSAVARREGDM